MRKTGVMICGHGSRDDKAVAEFANLQARLAERFPDYPVEYGFLEFATPIIRTGLDKLAAQGVDHVLAVAGMLLSAGHVKNDIASVLNQYQADHPNPDFLIEFARPLDVDAKMMYAAEARIRAAIEDADTEVPLEETMLMVVGRGTSDPDANGSISKICRMLWEGIGFGWGEVCYSGVTFPLVHAVRLGYRRIVVFPYFLFTGVLVKRIYAITDQIAEQFPDIEFLKAGYLNDHPKVIDTFEARIHGIGTGDNAMNCQLCIYREQVVGFEALQGLPQMSHHHHVEGIGTDASVQSSPDHDHGHSHDDHHHPPHPHDDHPHGPGKPNPEAVE